MTKRSRIVVFLAACLAGFMTQVSAFGQTTTAVYTVDATITYKVGKDTGSLPSSATAYFLSDGTFNLVGSGSYGIQFSGTYSVAKNGKTATIKSSASEVQTIENDIISIIEGEYSGATATVNGAKWSKITLSSGVPTSASITATGKGCESNGKKTKCKGFTIKVTATNWTCQGTCSSL